MKGFAELQAGLGAAWAANRPGPGIDHVMVALPSFSVGESLLSHYASRLPALEHRYLVAHLMLHRIERCEMVFLTCQAPGDEVLDYYTCLVPPAARPSVRSRFRLVVVPDRSHRAIAAKLLDRPDLIQTIRDSFGGRPAFIEPWNVTTAEVEVATLLQAPINGTVPELWPLGFKSAGRRLFAEARVPMPVGCEDVHTVDEVVAAVGSVRATHPMAPGVVIKHDNSGAGDGNFVVNLRDSPAGPVAEVALRAHLAGMPEWYLRDLAAGAVVEELITGVQFASPSVQVDISPYRDVTVLSTHEQVLGGDSGQVYTGCQFPANPAYAAELARHGLAIGERLAARGAVGRFSVDFAAARDAAGRWQVYALEINLRKGGTTHPYAVIRNLTSGRYEPDAGGWVTADGDTRAYYSTDNLVDSAWLGLPPATVIKAVANAGLRYDYRTGVGVVLHMLSCLAVDGRFGLTAIGRTPEHAAELYAATSRAVSAAT